MDDWFGLQGGLVVMGLLAAVPGCKDPDTDTTTGDTTSTEPGSTGDTGGTSTSSGATGDTPTGSGTGSATGTTGDAEVPPVCVSYGAKLAECNIEPEPGEPLDAEQTCARILMDSEVYGADCVQSLEAFFACPSMLSCAQLMGDPTACEAEQQAVEAACVPEVPPVCASFGAKSAECLMEPTAAMAYEQMCAYAVMQYSRYYGPDCVQAYEAFLACLSALSCEEFLVNTMGDPVCEAEAAAQAVVCN
jgi:hypothetical protein